MEPALYIIGSSETYEPSEDLAGAAKDKREESTVDTVGSDRLDDPIGSEYLGGMKVTI